MIQPKYLRKTAFGKFITSMNTPKEKRGKMIFGMGPQYVEKWQEKQGRQNKHHGNQPGSYKHKRNIIKASRRRNRGSI